MKKIDIYNTLYREISPLIHNTDPAALGGAKDEYDNEVNQIIKFIVSKKGIITATEIKEIISENYEALSLEDDELKDLVFNINKVIKKII